LAVDSVAYHEVLAEGGWRRTVELESSISKNFKKIASVTERIPSKLMFSLKSYETTLLNWNTVYCRTMLSIFYCSLACFWQQIINTVIQDVNWYISTTFCSKSYSTRP
jgi:hypothetical protein